MQAHECDFQRHTNEFDEAMEDWLRYRGHYSLHELLNNRDSRNMVLYAMLVTIQAAIRTAQHLILENYLPKPGTHEETFLILRKAGLLPGPLAEELATLASYRRQLVQFYHQVDMREIYKVLQNGPDILQRYRTCLQELQRPK